MSRGERFLKKKPFILAVVGTTVVSLILLNFLPFADKPSRASGSSSVSKTSTADFSVGTNSGIITSSDEVKIAPVEGWANDSYGFRKQVTVTAQASNAITKGHTLNTAAVGSSSFDGASDYFSLGNTFNNIPLPITVEAWINPVAADGAIFCTENLNGGAYFGFWMILDANRKITINYGDGTGAFSTDRRSKISDTAVTLGTWTHVSGVIRGETDMSIYFNGVDAGGAYSGTGGAIGYSSSSDYPAKIGAMNVGSPHFKGNIDELRIWSKGKSQAEILAEMGKEVSPQASLEGYYNFNQTTGNLIDNSGHNIAGSLVGNVAYSPYSNVWGGINTKSLIDAGKMRSDGNDLRMYYGSTEIERELVPATGKTLATSEATQVLYKAQAAVSGGATDNNYYLYYGDSDATDPIANVYEKKSRVKNAYIKPSDGSTNNSLQYSADNFPTTGDGTIELWYKWSNTVGKSWGDCLFKGDEAKNWCIFYDRSAYRLRVSMGNYTVTPTGTHNNAYDWNHIVLTWHNTDTAAELRVYENNVLTGTTDAGTKITNWPTYLKVWDAWSSYDGIELGHMGVYNTVKDAAWVSAQNTRTTAVPVVNGSRDASATFLHNFDGSTLDATEANGAYASGTNTATAVNTVMSGDYRLGDTNDERAGNSWVSGIYYWFDDFSGTGTKPVSWQEYGRANTASDAMSLGNDQRIRINKANIPTSLRLEADAKGTVPKFTFNDSGHAYWNTCADQISPAPSGLGDINWWPRDVANTFLSSASSSFIFSKRDYVATKKIYVDIDTPGNYSGLAWQYWNGTAWTDFAPTDGTAGFTKSGIIDFTAIYDSLSGANPPTVGACNFTGQTYQRFIKVVASGVTTPAKMNIFYGIYDHAENAFTNAANTLAGDLHGASGNIAISRATDAYKKIGMSKTSTAIKSYYEGRQTFSTSGTAFDNSMIGLSATGDATYDNFKVYKTLDSEPTAANAVEVAKYATGSYYSSPTSTSEGSGIIDLGWIGGWGTPNGFSASVTVPANTSIEFKIRSSAVGGLVDADWTDWGTIGTATSTGQYSVANASMPNITLGSNKYLQVKATFNTTDGISTPTMTDYTVYYVADIDAPSNPAVGVLTVNGTSITTSSWTSTGGPLSATFSGASDPGVESGVEGYYIYLGTSAGADPVADGEYQAHVGVIGDNQTYSSSISTPDDGKYYYLIFKTADFAGNVSSSSVLFQFGYDITAPIRPSFVSSDPAGYTTNNSFALTWPAGSDPAGANGQSGVKWYEYKRANDPNWSNTADASTRSVTGIQAYQEGVNAFYVRTIDLAGNISSNYQQVSYYWSGSAPAKPAALNVTPETSDQNSFTISWDKPVTAPEDPPVVGYYYSINASPTISNVTYVENGSDHVSIGPSPYATSQGVNTIYVVAVNSAGNLSFEPEYVASDTFTCITTAPATPTSVSLYDSSDRVLDRWMLTAQWVAGVGGGTVHHYSIERSLNGVDFASVATTTSTAYIDASGLSNTVEYYYRIKAVDNAGKESAPSSIVHKMPTGKYTVPPTILSGPTSSNIKSSSATITWTTDRASTSVVRYGMSNDGTFSASTGSMEPTTSHSVSVLGLYPSTVYYYQIQSLDEDRDYAPEAAYSATYSFTTGVAPAISETKVDNITLSSADISFITTTVATSTINFGTTNTYGTKVDDVSGVQATGHKVKLTNLTPGTTYHFRIEGTDIENNVLVSDDYQFDTLPLPKVENFSIEEIKGRPRPAFKAMWTTNVPTSTVLRYNPGNGEWKEEVSSKLDASHSVEVSDLLDNSTYQIIAGGRDSLGNLAESPSKAFTTPEDSRPPEISEIIIESSMLGGDEGKSQIAVGWKTDEPTTSKVEYGQGTNGGYTDSTPEDSELTTDHQVVISNLSPSATYHLKIVVKDKANNPTESPSQIFVTNQGREGVWNLILKTLSDIFGFIKITN